MSGNDMTDRELDEALAAITGRAAPAPTAAEARADADAAWVAEEEDKSATPWRAAVHWESREELAAAEAELAGLYVSRRGESPAGAQRHVERLLREAWWRPATEGWTSTGRRFRSVTIALADELDRLRTTPAIARAHRRPASTQEAITNNPPPPARRPASSTTVQESGRVLRNGDAR